LRAVHPLQIKTLDEIDREYAESVVLQKEPVTESDKSRTVNDVPNELVIPKGENIYLHCHRLCVEALEIIGSVSAYVFSLRNGVKRLFVAKRSVINVFLIAILYIISITTFIVSAMFFAGASRWSPDVFGYSIRTAYIASEISGSFADSLIAVKNVDPGIIQTKDEIAYLREDGSIAVEAVAAIFEYDDGETGFMISKLEDRSQILGTISKEFVIGKVIFRSETLGRVISFFTENAIGTAILVVLVILASLTAFFIIARSFLQTPKKIRRR